MSRYLKLAALCCAVSLAACGGGGDAAPEAEAEADAAASAPAVETPVPAPSSAPAPAPSPAPAPATVESPSSAPAPAATRTPIVDKYVGTWSGCYAYNTSESIYETFVVAKQSDTVLSGTYTGSRYAGITCEGVGVAEPVGQTLITFEGGTVQILGVFADKVVFEIFRNSPTGGKQLITLDAGKLRFGTSSSPKDAEGYPTELSPAHLKKQ